MKPQFDILGYLTPDEFIDLTLDEFQHYFVDAYPSSRTRRTIFEKYKRYLSDFQRLVSPNFVHWIGGSFVTDILNPNDIDFITLVSYRVVTTKNHIIKEQFEGEQGYKTYDVDAYFIRTYPYGHDKYWIYEKDLVIWRRDFGTDRNNIPKGMVQIKFQ